MMQQQFTLECPQCGSTQFRASSVKPAPKDPVLCSECGTSINLQEVKACLEQEARQAVEERLRNELKRK